MLLTSIIIFLGTFIHSLLGFGIAQVSMGLLPLIMPSAEAAIIFTQLGLIANAQIVYRTRSEFKWKRLKNPVIGLIIGLPLGFLLTNQLKTTQFNLVIGLTILLSVLFIILLKQKTVTKWLKHKSMKHKTIGLISGFLSGFLGGAVAIPGPPIIIYATLMMVSRKWSRRTAKNTMTSFFGLLMTYRLVILLINNLVTFNLFVQALTAIPALILGNYVGMKVSRSIPEEKFTAIVLIGLTINAILLIFLK